MLTISLPLILSTFALIFIAELPDKTALAALVLGARYKARSVIIGAWLAFVVQTMVAVLAGSLFTLLPAAPVRIASGVGFIVFAYLALRRNEEEVEEQEEEALEKTKGNKPVWLTSFLMIFAAEWGDLTQLATAALVAKNGHALSIGIGAVAALWSVTIVAVVAGSQLTRFISPKKLNIASGVLFALIGVFIIATSLGFAW